MQKYFRFLSLTLVILTAAAQGFGYNCSDSCEDQCEKGWLSHNVDPVCYTGCRAWVPANCWDLSDPYVSAMGEAGANVYPAAAKITASRNPQWTALDNVEKEGLRPFFGGLVDEVRLHWGSSLMDKWGSPPYEISLGNSSGQTYGLDVYLAPQKSALSIFSRLSLIGHELVHVRQYKQMGSSLQQFGRKYFQSFAKNGSYRHNGYEVEAYNLEDQILNYSFKFVQTSAPWDFVVCNRSNADTIYVSTAKYMKGLSLVASIDSRGWTHVAKNKCITVEKGIRADEPLWAYATTNTTGTGLVWSGSDRSFCVDKVKGFTFGHVTSNGFEACKNNPNGAIVGFRSLPNPWTATGKGLNTWTLTGSETHLTVCNHSGQKIFGAQLRFHFGSWKSEGWQAYENNQCRNWNLGGFTGPVFIYGENAGPTRWWNDNSQPGFCVSRPNAFSYQHGQPCKNGQIVHGFKKDLVPGENTWNYTP